MKYQERTRGNVRHPHWKRNTVCILSVFFVVLLMTAGFFCSDGMIQSFWLPRFAAGAGLKDFTAEEVSFSFLFEPSLTLKKVRFATSSGWIASADSMEADWKNREFFFSRDRIIRRMRVSGVSFQKQNKTYRAGDKSGKKSLGSVKVRQFFLTLKDGEKNLVQESVLSWKKVCCSSENLSLRPLSGKFLFSGAIRSGTDKQMFLESPSVSGSVCVSMEHGHPELRNLQMESGSMILLPSGKLNPVCSGELSGEILASGTVFHGKLRENGGSLLCWKLEKKQNYICDFELQLTDSELSARLSEFLPGKLSGLQGTAGGTIHRYDNICSIRTHGKLCSKSWNRLKSPQAEFKINGNLIPAKRQLEMDDSSAEFALGEQNVLSMHLKKGIFSPDEAFFPEGEAEFRKFPLCIGYGIPGTQTPDCSGKLSFFQNGKEKSIVLQMELMNRDKILASVDGDTKLRPDSWNGAFRITLPDGSGLVETSGTIRDSGKFDGWAGVRNSSFSGAFRLQGETCGEQSMVELVAAPTALDGLNGHFLKESYSFAGASFQMRHLHRSGENTMMETGHIRLNDLSLVSASEKFSFHTGYEADLTTGTGKVHFTGLAGEKKTPFADLTLTVDMNKEQKFLIASELLELETAEKLLSSFRSRPESAESGTALLPDPTFPFSPEETARSTSVRLNLKGIRSRGCTPFSCSGLIRFCDGLRDFSELDISGTGPEKKSLLRILGFY